MFQHEEKLSLPALLEDPSVDGGDAQGSVTPYPELAQYEIEPAPAEIAITGRAVWQLPATLSRKPPFRFRPSLIVQTGVPVSASGINGSCA
jgi:hypothetical protein